MVIVQPIESLMAYFLNERKGKGFTFVVNYKILDLESFFAKKFEGKDMFFVVSAECTIVMVR